jgi:hypothetical protein
MLAKSKELAAPPSNIVVKAKKAATAASQAKKQIGAGVYGVVYDIGNNIVQKELPNTAKQKVLTEADLQAIGAESGISPQIHAVETGPVTGFGKTLPMAPGPNPQVTGQIEMQNLNPTHSSYRDYISKDKFKAQSVDLKTHQQLAQLALKNVSLTDRHPGNIMVNQMTGRPSQIDYGLAKQITDPVEKVTVLTQHVANGFGSAGLDEEGHILLATVNDLLLNKNDVASAMDVAKQGMAILQKIKTPIKENPDYVIPQSASDVDAFMKNLFNGSNLQDISW